MKKVMLGVIIGAAGYAAVMVMGVGDTSGSVSSEHVTTPILSPNAQEIDQMFTDAYSGDQPGASVIVAKGGNVILKKGYGLADAEHNIAIQPHMPFRIGSLTKQFTAVAILMLEQDGLLKLTDSIQGHLPDYPTYDEVVTIEHLLTHTSGIPNYTDFPDFYPTLRTDMSTDEMLTVFKDKPLDFKPGSKWNYSNSAYVLLGAIIERRANMSYAEFISKRIFKPLDMTNSHYGSNVNIIPSRAKGYSLTKDGFTHSTYISMSIPHAAGSLLSSSEDMLKWHSGLMSGSILPRELLDKAWKSGILNNGDSTGYGYGWFVGAEQGHAIYMHGGGIPGFHTYGISMPDDDVYVAVLSNMPGKANLGALAQQAAALVAGIPLVTSSKVTLSNEELGKYAGQYLREDGDIITLSIEDGKLVYKRGERDAQEILNIGNSSFLFPGSTTSINFEHDENGLIFAMVTKRWGGMPIKSARQ